MQTLQYIGLLGGALSFAAYIPFIQSMIRGEARPERAKYFIWALSNVLIVLSYYLLGARETLWLPLAYAAGSAVVAVMALFYGKEGWGVYEKLILVVAAISAVRWVFFDNVFFALVINLAIGYMSYLPRLKRLAFDEGNHLEKPEDWVLFTIGAGLTVLAIPQWTVEIALLPVVVFVMNAAVLALALRRQPKIHEDHSHIS